MVCDDAFDVVGVVGADSRGRERTADDGAASTTNQADIRGRELPPSLTLGDLHFRSENSTEGSVGGDNRNVIYLAG